MKTKYDFKSIFKNKLNSLFEKFHYNISEIDRTNIDIKKNKEEINFVISAKSFLHSQVRIMVGTLIDIGLGKISKSVSEIIELKKRDFAGVTAPAQGLYLTKVDY